MMTLLEIKELKVHYYTLSGIVRAVDGVDFDVGRGEWVSIVGESGCGKSTLAYAILRLVPPPGRIVSGNILLDGVDLLKLSGEDIRKLRGSKISMVFQDPMTSLDPLRRIGDQMVEAITEHEKLGPKAARAKAEKLLASVGLTSDMIDRYPHQLSGGQRQRVTIAIAMALNPSLLIADEPTTALDGIVQDRIMDLLEGFKEQGTSIMLVTHDLALAAERSDRIAIMYAGKIVEYGPVDLIIDQPMHPYSKALLESTPKLRGPKKLTYIPGYPPDLRRPPSGCRFHPRCPRAMKICQLKEPRAEGVDGRIVACWLYLEGGDASE